MDDLIARVEGAEITRLRAELSAAIGYLENARIDLQTGCTKAVAIRTIEGGLKRARAALDDYPDLPRLTLGPDETPAPAPPA